MRKLEPIAPGEILLEEFLKPMGLSQYRLAKEIGVPAQRISEIVAGKRSITAVIPIYGFVGSLAYPTAIGCVRRLPTTQSLQSAFLAHC